MRERVALVSGGRRIEALRLLGGFHGHWLNKSAIARALSTTVLQVRRMLRVLGNEGAVRLLPSLPAPAPPDAILRPRLYLRPRAWPGVFGRTSRRQHRIPIQGMLAARLTEQIIVRETRMGRPTGIYAMGRYRARGVDLVVQRDDGRRLGFLFEPEPRRREAWGSEKTLLEALERGWIDSAFLVTCNQGLRLLRGRILCICAPVLMAFYREWTRPVPDPRALGVVMRWVGRKFWTTIAGYYLPEGPMVLGGAGGPWKLLHFDSDRWLPEDTRDILRHIYETRTGYKPRPP